METVQSLTNRLSYKPSKYQIDIWEFVVNGKGNGIIEAVAGSGKTSTIVDALSLIPSDKKVIYFAFNKAIVEELSKRVPQRQTLQVKTLHGFGFGCIRSKIKNVKLDDRKVTKVISVLIKEWEEEYEYGQRVKKLVDLLRNNLIETEGELRQEGLRHNIELMNNECGRAFEVLELLKNSPYEIDFCDMVYEPAAHDYTIPYYDFVFIDECQDLNRAQQELVKKAAGKFGRIIAVGDPHQAIYGFAGADVNSFNRLADMPNTTKLPLSVNYRCGAAIAKLAIEMVPEFEAWEHAKEGEVDYKAKKDSIVGGDMVLCRNTAPLVKLCFEFLREEKKAYVKGADIGKGLTRWCNKSKTNKIDELWRYFDSELEKILHLLRNRNIGASEEELREMMQYVLMHARVETIKVIAASGNCQTVFEIVEKIKTIFKDSAEGICLSTIHKAKGLECKRVFIIDKFLMPSKYAKQQWQKDQETNIEYVAYTRAKDYLGFVNDWSYKRIG